MGRQRSLESSCLCELDVDRFIQEDQPAVHRQIFRSLEGDIVGK